LQISVGGTTPSVGRDVDVTLAAPTKGLSPPVLMVLALFSISEESLLFSSVFVSRFDKFVGVGRRLFNVNKELDVRIDEFDEEEGVARDDNSVVVGGSFLFIPAVASSPDDATTTTSVLIAGEALSGGSKVVGMVIKH
jgi:hypothetical protein